MSIKREAAFHEAGHAIVAYRSRFHNVIAGINLERHGAGEIFISLSKKKLAAAGKSLELAALLDPEVAIDLAVILCAGLVAERIAEERDDSLKADSTCAVPDHRLMEQQLEAAGLPKKFDTHEDVAKALLISEWALVDALAERLFKRISVDAVEIREFIENWGR